MAGLRLNIWVVGTGSSAKPSRVMKWCSRTARPMRTSHISSRNPLDTLASTPVCHLPSSSPAEYPGGIRGIRPSVSALCRGTVPHRVAAHSGWQGDCCDNAQARLWYGHGPTTSANWSAISVIEARESVKVTGSARVRDPGRQGWNRHWQ